MGSVEFIQKIKGILTELNVNTQALGYTVACTE